MSLTRTSHSELDSRTAIRIGVIVNAVGGYSRGVVRGISSFAQARGWELCVEGINHPNLNLKSGLFSALIVQASTPALQLRAKSTHLPVVNVSSTSAHLLPYSVTTDDHAAGAMAAEHLLRRGYRDLACFTPDKKRFAQLRHGGFEARAASQGVSVVRIGSLTQLRGIIRDRRSPLGVLASNDRSALTVLDTCRALGVRVPEDVAVIGVDNDDLAQSLAGPPLSTVDTARERIGFEAAALLEKLLTEKHVEPTHLTIAPKGILVRRSTDSIVVADDDVARASRFIQLNASRLIGVTDVCRDATISRRQLERRFRITLGRSVLDEITRHRVERARQLLIDTDLTLAQVAIAAGFRSTSYFSVLFKARAGQTPARLRQAYRV